MALFREANEVNRPASPPVSPGLRIVGAALRLLIILALVVLTARVSAPQSKTLWSVYEAPLDLLRLVLGASVCVFIGTRMFVGLSNHEASRTWAYLGMIVLPFTIICILAVW